MSYEMGSLTENCYPNTTILVNKYGITDEQKLSDVESMIVSIKTAKWEQTPLSHSWFGLRAMTLTSPM